MLHLMDGLRGDDDLSANGQIRDAGSPGFHVNRAPKITAVSGQQCTETEVSVQFDATDPDRGDVLNYSVAFVEKAGAGAVNNPTGFSIDSHGQFHWTPGGGQLGQYTFQAKVMDRGGLHAERTFAVTTLGVVDGVLTIVGTGGVDKVDVKPTDGDADDLTVRANEKDYHFKLKPKNNPDNPYTGVTSIHACGLGGNDQFTVAIKITIGTWLEGGAGNDQLTGGGGDDVIFGGSGDDTIDGGTGNDFLIGGVGKDKITGGAGLDILVSHEIDPALDLAALQAISRAWVAQHTNAEANIIDDMLDETLSDADIDQLTGGAGADLFIINTSDTITDFQFGKPKANKDGDVVIKDGNVVS